MKRGEFLISTGKGVLLMCSGSCMLASCSSGDDGGGTQPPGNGGPTTVSVSLSGLSEVGAQTTKSGVLFFRIGEGQTTSDFVATEAVCPHQGGQLVWEQENGYIECQLHFSRYESDGDTIRGPQNAAGTTRDLKVYAISISNGNLIATVS
ncbi:ubiquinol-cytochrome c reductase iron-sulfur subunit [Christiangramia crocea]|uniref:Rieske 2Fe-2S domain-containing protein n=1 Tax=Christiangramia crocea TaxID=2904124 RepID=A0A9X1UWL7_9FLAO|nr:Rieske (2Fe-2S) protein [Gramella crocea]MCG9971634.1 Rieske 2Fe-2S domain-containing protein [Gramella crocea]